ncbi:hypothetical protein HDU97_001609 [Phlyctochytrium planicorne]|nr:hypothetical protein HDU97_001609 [Phlyctochytrium planicorne]
MDVLGFGQIHLSRWTTGGFAEKDIGNLSGKVAIVTGASAGVGKIAAGMMANKCAHVILACRNVKKAEGVVEELRSKGYKDGRMDVMELDLASFASVKRFAEDFIKRNLGLHILMNNAAFEKRKGVMAVPKFTLTVDGIEMQAQSNHLGHFYLTQLLLPVLRRTASQVKGDGFGVRIVNLSSTGHLFPAPILKDWSKVNDPKAYSPYIAYCHSKRMNILFTRELQKRLDVMQDSFGQLDNIYVNAVHPGVVQTDLYVGASLVNANLYRNLYGLFMISAEQGALTQVYCATHESIAKSGIKAQYFVPIAQLTRPMQSLVRDEEVGVSLWEWSERTLKEKGYM